LKLNPLALANASTVVVVAVYVICRLAVGLFPDLTLAIAQSWFHGLDLTIISGANLSVGSFVLGLVSLSGLTWVTGYLFAKLYNSWTMA